MINPMSLEGKKILITGASSGIGRASEIYCSELGARVVLLGRNREQLDSTISKMHSSNHIVLVHDLYKDEAFDELFLQMITDGVKLDGFVHCAGIPCIMNVKSLTRNRLKNVMNLNFHAFIDLARCFVKRKYSNDNASIIGISSSATVHPRMYEMGYIASKAAMEASVKVMAQEFWKRKIRVNCVSPGAVMTEMVVETIREHNNKELMDSIASKTVMGWQQPEDISKVCAFILSDASCSITGQILRADGGYI